MRAVLLRTLLLIAAVVLLPHPAAAQADEIQVYDGGLAAPGVFNLTVHNNFTPHGIEEPAFPGAVVSDQSLNGVSEWAYGVTRWFEAGLYLPLYSHDQSLGWTINGFKLRTLFAVPGADDRRFFFGANMEFSYNSEHWDDKRFTSEVRPIVGWHFGTIDVIFNPIVDTRYDGLKNLEFVPAERVAFRVSPFWQIAIEEYADYGIVSDLESAAHQAHQLFGVFDFSGGPFDVEGGVGVGLTDASDRLTFKVILSRDFNQSRR
jgi:hypothetical protein